MKLWRTIPSEEILPLWIEKGYGVRTSSGRNGERRPELVILWGDGPGNRKLPLSPEGFSSVFPSAWGSLWDPSLSLCSFALTPSTGGATPHPNNSSNLSLQLHGYCIELSSEAENQKVLAELSPRCFVELV